MHRFSVWLAPEFTQQHLVDGLNLTPSLFKVVDNVLAYIINIIKEVAEGIEHLIGLGCILRGIGIGDDADAHGFDVDIDIFTGHEWVAIEMDGTRLCAMDMDALAAEGLDLGIVAQRLHKQVGSNLRGFQGVERLHDDDVHHAISHGSAWGNIGIVAILGSIGAGDEESAIAGSARIVDNLIGLRTIFQSFFQHILNIGDGSALACLCELKRDEGIEAHAASAEEGLTVDDTIVEGFNGAVVDQLQGTTYIDGNAEMTRKPVAGTTRNDAQGGIGVYQRASHLVDSTVASDSYHHVNAIGSTLAGYLGSMTPILGEAQLNI